VVHSNFKAEWLKDPDLKSWLQKDSSNEDFIIAHAARSPSQMQTSPCHCDVIVQTDTKVY